MGGEGFLFCQGKKKRARSERRKKKDWKGDGENVGGEVRVSLGQWR